MNAIVLMLLLGPIVGKTSIHHLLNNNCRSILHVEIDRKVKGEEKAISKETEPFSSCGSIVNDMVYYFIRNDAHQFNAYIHD